MEFSAQLSVGASAGSGASTGAGAGASARAQLQNALAGSAPKPRSEVPAGLSVSWAHHQDDVRAAQRLRYRVFSQEMGAHVKSPLPGHDTDLFDNYCEHLLVRDGATRQVLGTCRVLTPGQAKRVGSTYIDTAFDLTRLRGLRERMLELGRSCVHPDHRQGGVATALWRALQEFMSAYQLETLIGCASLPMLNQGQRCFDPAASIWQQLRTTHLAPIEHQVRPRRPLPLDRLNLNLPIEPPVLITGYLRLGAKVLGPPAWDADFNCADLPMMLRLADVPHR